MRFRIRQAPWCEHEADRLGSLGLRVVPPERRRRSAAILALALATALFLWASWRLPVSRALEPLPEPTLVLVSADGHAYARRGAYKENPVDVTKLPRHVVEPVLAIEDRRFYRHVGVDARGIIRAAWANTRAGEVVQGGSTITQQLAKTTFLSNERSLKRKVQEVLIAFWLELRLSKDQILSRYLSSVYFGDGVYGLRAAALHYFDKAPEELTLAEAAMLAGVINAPSRLNPRRHLRAAQARSQVVLAAMVDAGFIEPAEARVRPVRPRPGRRSLPTGSYFADWVSPQAKDLFSSDYGEVRVPTTMHMRLQQLAERVVRRGLAREAGSSVGEAALVAMRPDGSVVAMVGGGNYKASQFNRVTQAKRQPGSAFKLFVYLAALRKGAHPQDVVSDTPLQRASWRPRNFNGRYAGPVTLQEAFALSSNVAAVRVAEQVGTRAIISTARDLAVASDLRADPTLALGTSEMTLLELTSAYAAVARGEYPVQAFGLQSPEREEESGRGRHLTTLAAHRERQPLISMLRAVVAHGTGQAASLPFPAFGKTGTTQDHKDAVFVGFAGDLIVGVWVGNDDHTPMKGITGGGLPAEMWREFMLGAYTLGLLDPGGGAAQGDGRFDWLPWWRRSEPQAIEEHELEFAGLPVVQEIQREASGALRDRRAAHRDERDEHEDEDDEREEDDEERDGDEEEDDYED